MSETRPEGYCKDCRVEPAAERPDGTLASRCAACAALRNEAAKTARAKAKRRGLCRYPGGCERKPAAGRTMCREHLDYYVAANNKQRGTVQ